MTDRLYPGNYPDPDYDPSLLAHERPRPQEPERRVAYCRCPASCLVTAHAGQRKADPKKDTKP